MLKNKILFVSKRYKYDDNAIFIREELIFLLKISKTTSLIILKTILKRLLILLYELEKDLDTFTSNLDFSKKLIVTLILK